MLAYIKHTSNCGTPAMVCSDRGSQLVKAGKVINSINESWNWAQIVDTTAKSGTKWKFVESGCQWRNGLVERQVATMKRTMSSVLETNQSLNYAELDTLFASAANVVNQRPLAVRSFSQDDFCSITPNDLLLGRNRLAVQPTQQYGDCDNIGLRLELIEEMEKLWWDQWIKQVFPALVPFRKWKTEYRNLQFADVVLVNYPSKVDKGDFRLG